MFEKMPTHNHYQRASYALDNVYNRTLITVKTNIISLQL